MKMLYTANGRYIRCCTEEGTRPVIIVCEKEYEVDVQEFMLWSILNWRILREEEISSFYEKMASSSNVTIHRSWQDCVQRLLVRGLLVVGTGDTEYDALYDLLSCRFIIISNADICRLFRTPFQHEGGQCISCSEIIMANAVISLILLSHDNNGDRHFFEDCAVSFRKNRCEENDSVYSVLPE